MQKIKPIQVLLVQIRKDPALIQAERNGFVEFSGLSEDQFITLDVYRNPAFSPDMALDYDALMIGGLSDDHSHIVDLPSHFVPFIDNVYALMKRAIDIKMPSLLSCGGFMLASMMLGANVVIDPEQAELGVYPISLTREAKHDVLFKDFPDTFNAVSGHIKSTINLPSSCMHLAYSDRCRVHGFRVKEAPFYAFQFHPEVKCDDLKDRIEAYKDKYFETEASYRAFIDLMRDTSDANHIVSRFVNLVKDHTKSNRILEY
jgi:GMP synthase (glutamine-hydrolysing)